MTLRAFTYRYSWPTRELLVQLDRAQLDRLKIPVHAGLVGSVVVRFAGHPRATSIVALLPPEIDAAVASTHAFVREGRGT